MALVNRAAIDASPNADRRKRIMKTTTLALILLASVMAGAERPAIAGSFMHQSPKLYHRVRSPCRDGEVLKRTGGGGRRGVLSCAPR